MTFKIRRRPREPREGYEVFLDGEWRDWCDAGTPDGASDRAVLKVIEDPSRREAAEDVFPRWIEVDA